MVGLRNRLGVVEMTIGLWAVLSWPMNTSGSMQHQVEIRDAVSDDVHQILPAQAERITYSTQQFVYLDPGQTHIFKLKDGTPKAIQLDSVEVYRDPVIDLARRARVRVVINGKPVELICAPYVMPTEVDGLRIQADTTSAWLRLPKRVQFSLWDASDPIVDTNLFGFPLEAYRLFSQGTQAYNEPVHLGHRDGDPAGQRFYHDYGVDLAGYEGKQKVLSCIAGRVIELDRAQGDLHIRDAQGLTLHFGHLDSIASDMRVGTVVRRGQPVGVLGRRGDSGNFSHLHIGTDLSLFESAVATGRVSRNLNLYPWLVAAYQAQTQARALAVARPFKSVLTGDMVRFDSSACLTFTSTTSSYEWAFHDGTRVSGPSAQRVFENPGCYVAGLWMTDDQGNVDVDFCTVRVYSRSEPEDVVPTLFVTYAPSRDVRADQPVCFRIWPQGLEVESICVDFGDGRQVTDYAPYSSLTHRFARPGMHVVTVRGRAGDLPVTQKVKVVVDE